MAKKQETAWELDEERVAASADGSYIAGIPGLWRAGEAVHADALGFTVSDFREIVAGLDLPLREVRVAEGSASREFAPPDDRLPSSPVGVLASPVAGIEETDEPLPPERSIADEVAADELYADATGADDQEETS